MHFVRLYGLYIFYENNKAKMSEDLGRLRVCNPTCYTDIESEQMRTYITEVVVSIGCILGSLS